MEISISSFCCRYSENDSESRTPLLQRFSCGVGSVMMDITRQLLFSFRLVIFMQVFGISAANAGWLMLYGLITAAASAPISALLVDNIKVPYLSQKLGRRKSWHLIGTLIGSVVIPLYFSSCFLCRSDRGQWQLMIYIPVVNTLLSFSFGLMEIGHLSIIPVIAKDQSEAVELNAWRTAFTFLSGIVTYLVAWAIFGLDANDHLSADSSMDFTVMTVILIGIGLVFVVIFHAGTKEPYEENDEKLSKRRLRTGENDTATGEQTAEKEKTCHGMTNLHRTIGEKLPNESGSRNVQNKANSIGEKNGIETLKKDSQAHSSASLRLGDDDKKGLECCETELDPYHPGGLSLKSATNSTLPGDPESAEPVTPAPKTARAWLKEPHLYKVAVIFTCTMSVISISYAYLPLFLIYRVQFGKDLVTSIYCIRIQGPLTRLQLLLQHPFNIVEPKDAIAYLPLIMLTSGAASSGMSKKLVGVIGSKRCFILASLLVIGAGLWFYFITKSNRVMTYPATVLLGFGFSAMLVNALSFATEFIGDNKSTSGVVFAVMSLMSYITSGSLITTIQNLFPKGSNSEVCEECGDYVRHVFSFVPGSLAAISVLIVLLFQASQTICKPIVSQTNARVEIEAEDTRL